MPLRIPNWSSPLAMAQDLDPTVIRTPALELLNERLVQAYRTPNSKLLLSIGPQEGKSFLVGRWFLIWSLWLCRQKRCAYAAYDVGLARTIQGQTRDTVNLHADQIGLRLNASFKAKQEWQLAEGGGVLAVGIGTGFTGRPADLLVIDDPFKGAREAESPTMRENVWTWWQSVASARLAPGAPVVVMHCMTGDTPVLMADGLERPLRDVRQGDRIATYEGGRLSVSTVENWASKGPDSVFSIRMKSGTTVRANARHPFLTVENGREVWRKTSELRTGAFILRATGASGEASSALSKSASYQPSARACATRTITSSAGLLDTEHLRSTPKRTALGSSSTFTASRSRTTSGCENNRGGFARPVDNLPHSRATVLSGMGSSWLITTTRPARFADFSAMTATSSLVPAGRPKLFVPSLTTYSVTLDEVVEVVPCGVEEVFDLQVERTENFIASGLVSHNTRWHQDDLIGRLDAVTEGQKWDLLNIPAQADHDPNKGQADILGRQPGEFMISARGRSREEWQQRKINAGSRQWAAMYQGRPSPAEGSILKREWWESSYFVDVPYITRDDGTRWVLGDDAELIITVDCAFKGTQDSDYVAMQVWMRRGVHVYLLDQINEHLDFVGTTKALQRLAARWPQAVLKVVEDAANGPAVMSALRNILGGIVGEIPQGSKEARAYATTPYLEAGNVHVPDPSLPGFAWVGDFVEQAAMFPNGANDDTVDTYSMAVNRLLIQPLNAEVPDMRSEDEQWADMQGWSVSPF